MRLVVAAPLALTALLFAVPSAHAADVNCSGTIGAGRFEDNVVVPPGRTCSLVGTRVGGNVLVGKDATLVARAVQVGGSIRAENSHRVVVRSRTRSGRTLRSRIGGNIHLKLVGDGSLVRNIVTGSIQLFGNGRVDVRGNRVDGNLQCTSNSPRPTGSRNRVGGNKENQCSGL